MVNKTPKHEFLSYWNMNQPPFSSPYRSPKDYHKWDQCHKIILSVDLALEQSNHIILIKGGEGTGKSHMANYLYQTIDYHRCEVWISSVLKAETQTQSLLNHLSRFMGIDNQTSLSSLSQSLRDLAQAGRKAVWIIDNTHLADQKTLEHILFLNRNSKNNLGILLLGRSDVLDNILPKNKYSAYTIEPMKWDPFVEYILWNLKRVGIDKNIFPHHALLNIYKLSRGIPSEINKYAMGYLIDEYIEKTQRGEHRIKQKHEANLPQDIDQSDYKTKEETPGSKNITPQKLRERSLSSLFYRPDEKKSG